MLTESFALGGTFGLSSRVIHLRIFYIRALRSQFVKVSVSVSIGFASLSKKRMQFEMLNEWFGNEDRFRFGLRRKIITISLSENKTLCEIDAYRNCKPLVT